MKSIKGLCPEELKEQYLSYDETANEGQDIDFAAEEETAKMALNTLQIPRF